MSGSFSPETGIGVDDVIVIDRFTSGPWVPCGRLHPPWVLSLGAFLLRTSAGDGVSISTVSPLGIMIGSDC